MQEQVFADAANGLAPEVHAKDLAAARKATRDEKARASIARNTVGKRKANGADYGGGLGRWATVTVLSPGNRGRNARGLTGAKRGYGGSQPKGAKDAKKQNTHVRGAQPRLAATRWDAV